MPLLKSLREKGFYIEIESNGTIVPQAQFVAVIDQWNISPKLANSGNPLSAREIPRAYEFFTSLPSSFFIYIIQSEDDLFEVQGLVEKYHIALNKVILMPEATDRETLLERGRWLAELCKDRGYRFSTRLQVLLWGDKRGA
jgi:organic radical activating enzyme